MKDEGIEVSKGDMVVVVAHVGWVLIKRGGSFRVRGSWMKRNRVLCKTWMYSGERHCMKDGSGYGV